GRHQRCPGAGGRGSRDRDGGHRLRCRDRIRRYRVHRPRPAPDPASHRPCQARPADHEPEHRALAADHRGPAAPGHHRCARPRGRGSHPRGRRGHRDPQRTARSPDEIEPGFPAEDALNEHASIHSQRPPHPVACPARRNTSQRTEHHMNSPTTSTTRAPKKTKIVVWILLAVAVIAAVIGYFVAQNNSTAATPAATDAAATEQQVVRENSRVLSQAPDENAVLVEFLDFECEACGAAYPFVEELRAEHSDNVTFVQRYFPLPGHLNSMNAAVAVEAAAQQDAYDDMYKKMFDTQTQWGESADNKSALFRTYAEDLGLDMAAYDTAVA